MIFVFTITEIKYLVESQFYDLVQPFSYVYCIFVVFTFSDYTICLVFRIARKAAMALPNSFTIF